MAKQFTVKTRLEAEDRASRVIGRVEGRFKRLGNFLKSRFVITLGDITRGVSGAVRAFTSLIEAANVQEDAIKKLDASLKRIGPSAGEVSQALQAQAAALQKVTRFGDEQIIQGQALLATFTQNKDELANATKAALDFAAATGRDLNTAFLLLGKAAAGQTAELSRYGIILDEGIPKSEKFAAVLGQMNEQFGGQAQAEAKTFRGVMKQVSNAFGDLKEKAGQAVTENEAIRNTLIRLRDTLSDPALVEGLASVVGFFSKITELAATSIIKIQEFSRTVSDFATATEQANIPLADFQAQADRMGISVLELKRRVAEAKRENDQLNASTRELAATTGAAAAKVDGLTAAQKRSIRIEKELDKLRNGAKETLESLGLTLKGDLIASLEANKQKLSEVMQLEREGLLTREQAAEGARQLAAEEEALRAVLDGTASSVDDYKSRLDEVTQSHSQLEQSAVSAADGFRGLRGQAGGLISDLRSVSTEALAASANITAFDRSSTRISFRGGSRLRSSPDDPLFPGLSGTGGTFTVAAGTRTSGWTSNAHGTIVGRGWSLII